MGQKEIVIFPSSFIPQAEVYTCAHLAELKHVTRLRGDKTLMLWLYLVKLVKQAFCLLAKKHTIVKEMENILSLSFTPVSFSASRQVQCFLYKTCLHLKGGITLLHASVSRFDTWTLRTQCQQQYVRENGCARSVVCLLFAVVLWDFSG